MQAPASEQLLPKSFMYGNLCAATSFHYSPYASLFYFDQETEGIEDGYPVFDSALSSLLNQLFKDAYEGTNHTSYEEYLGSYEF
jgi:hypothetical protein